MTAKCGTTATSTPNPKETTMNDLTPEDRARALELYRLYFLTLTGVESDITDAADMSPSSARAWVAVEAHVIASHACPDVESDQRVRAWRAIAAHRFFKVCYSADGTLVDAMLARLDAAHTHACEPVWRPTAADEIQAGWEVRSRAQGGYEAAWGTAHDRDSDGDWHTERGRPLTWDAMGWTYETTAPLPEPEPWPEELVDAITGTIWPIDRAEDARAVLDLLAARGLLDRDALAEGDQS